MNNAIRMCIWACLAAAGANVSWAAEGLWQDNGRPVCTAADRQVNCQIVTDGQGGAIIAWADLRNGTYDIYAQRVDALGNTLWANDGVAVCTASGNQLSPQLISANYYGAIITWQDQRNVDDDIYAQRVNGSGVPQWAANGVPVCMEANNQSNPKIVTDGSGGAIIAWQDERNGDSDIFALRLNNVGAVGAGWTASGVTVCAAANNQRNPQLAYSGNTSNGSAIITCITWEDWRNGVDSDVYAQMLNGSVLETGWAVNGVAVCTLTGNQTKPQLISDNYKGAIITWEDWRTGNGYVYVQHFPNHGNPQWGSNGRPVCNLPTNQYNPKIATDGSYGAVIAWEDWRQGNADIYAQHLNDSGILQWTVNGVAVCNETFNQSNLQLISNGGGSTIMVWEDGRNGSQVDIWMQRLNGTGSTAWPSDGVVVCDAMLDQLGPQLISDGNGGMIVAWRDGRNGSDADIYAQRVIRPKPEIATINSPAEQGSVFHAAITGNYFQSAPGSVTAVKLTRSAYADIPAGNLNIANNISLTCDFYLTAAAWGDWLVVLTDTYGQQSAEPVLLSVLQPTATTTVTSTSTITPTPVVMATLTPSPTLTSTPTLLPGELKYPDHAFAVPNPFLPALQQKAKIVFKLPESNPDCKIKIINLKGRVVRTLVQQHEWDGRNEQGALCEGGVYFFQVETGGKRFSGKVVLIK